MQGFAVANKHIPVLYRTIGMSGNDVNGGVRIPNCGGLKFPTLPNVYF